MSATIGSPRRTRVMHVIEAMHLGGAESVVVEHTRHAAPDVETMVCALNRGGPALAAAAALGARTFDLSGSGKLFQRLARLRSLLRHERIDVVNAHNPTGSLYGVPAARWAGVPAVFRTEHSIHYANRHSQVYAAVEPALTRFVERVICVCEAVRESHARRLRWADERFVNLPNGVSADAPSKPRAALRAALGLESGALAVLALGGMRPPKSFDVLIDAFAIVARDQAWAYLIMAGDGPLRADLEARAVALGIHDRVLWLGARADVSDLVEASDLFVVSSQREGLSLSLLEAMRGGRAAVVTRVGGNAEAVEDGETGVVVPPHDPAALARALLDLLADPGRRTRLGEAARARWARDYTAERMVRDTEALYGAALVRRGRVPAAVAVAGDACA